MQVRQVVERSRVPARPGPSASVAPTPGRPRSLQRSPGDAATSQWVDGERERPDARRAVLDVLSARGEPLPDPLRGEMEHRFGMDLSHLRVHTDAAARRSAAMIGARAYTVGHHVVFTPSTARDRHVVAHEIAHTIDQAAGPVPGTDQGHGLRMSSPGDAGERAAEATARSVLARPATRTGPLPTVDRPAPVRGEVSIQRVKRELRTSTNDQRRKYEVRRVDPRGRTRGAGRPQVVAGPQPPLVTPDGERLWDGTRRLLGIRPETVRSVLSQTPQAPDQATGRIHYKCANRRCGKMVLTKSHATAAREKNWIEIDHVQAILPYVQQHATTVRFPHTLPDGTDTTVEAVLLRDAKAIANYPKNLRALCKNCNRGKRAAMSGSRTMDQTGPRFV